MRCGPDGVSGVELAKRLGCSRAAIHRHVSALRGAGVAIDGTGTGYRLASASDPVSSSIVEAGLQPPILGPVRWTAETGSTNDDAAAAARAGAVEGLVIGADLQTAGRGRRGREWTADPGDALLFSVVLRPRSSIADAGVIPLLVAVAVCDALGPNAGLIWPNDIVIADTKVCGVLCEVSGDESGIAWVVAGIGLNVRRAPELSGSRWTAGALAQHGETRTRGQLLVSVLNALGERYSEWRAKGPEPLLEAYRTRDLLRGREVRIQIGSEHGTGVADGLDERGCLMVRTAQGVRVLSSGEVTKRAADG